MGSALYYGNSYFAIFSQKRIRIAATCVSKGITSGTTETTFSPDATVTRAQTVSFLYSHAGSPAVSGNSFADVNADAYYANAVAWAVTEEITAGTSTNTFSPNADCTRGQIVSFLYRAQ